MLGHRPRFFGSLQSPDSNLVAVVLVAIGFVFTLPVEAHAAAITNSSTNVNIIAAPPNIREGNLESNSLFRVFEEQTTFVTNLGTDTQTIGEHSSSHTDGFLTAGVKSFFVHFDPVGEPIDPVTLTDGFLEFNNNILALIWEAPDLDNSDSILGLAATTYAPQDLRGIEVNHDRVTFTSLNRVDFRVRAGGEKIDSFRVLVRVPEPAQMAVFGIGLAAMCLMRRRAA